MTYLITVGVISAQKNTLRLPTAWEANMPTMENAMENLSLTLSLIPEGESEGDSEGGGQKGREKEAGRQVVGGNAETAAGQGTGEGLGPHEGSSPIPLPQCGVQPGALSSLWRLGSTSRCNRSDPLGRRLCWGSRDSLWAWNAVAHTDSARIPEATSHAWQEGRLVVSLGL